MHLSAAETHSPLTGEAKEKAYAILKKYEAELADDPNNVRLMTAIGQSYYSLGDYPLAEKYLSRALKLAPNDNSIKASLGLSYLFTEDLDQSKSLLEDALKEDPKNTNIISGLGRIAQLNYDFPKAEKLYLEALKIDPDNITTLIFLGNLRLQQKNFPEALKIYDQLKNQKFDQPWLDQDILKAKLGPAMEEIKQLEALGDLEKASTEYHELLVANPQLLELYIELGGVYTKMEMFREALHVYERGLMLYPKSSALQVAKGMTYLAETDYSKSNEIFIQVLKEDPKNSEAYVGLGRINELNGNLSKAEELYKKALIISPYNSSALTYMAALNLKQRRYEDAKENYSKLLKIYPNSDWVKHGIEESEFGPFIEKINKKVELKEFKAAEKLYKQLLTIMPDDADVYYKFGQFYHSLDRNAEAIDIYQEGLRRNPADADLQTALGFAYLSENELNEAEKIFYTLMKRNPRNVDAIVGNGKLLELDENFKEAEALYRKALNIDRNNITALSALANLRMKQERYNEALKIFERIKKLDPTLTWLPRSIEDAKFSPILKEIQESEERNDYDAAEMLYLQLISESPQTADYYIGLGQLYMQRNRIDDAIQVYSEGLREIPKSNKLLIALGYAYLELKDLKKSSSIFKNVLSEELENADAITGLGKIAEIEGKGKEASKYYNQALSYDPNNITALTYLANLYLKEKKYKEAKATFIKLKWLQPNAAWISYALQDIYFAPTLEQIKNLEQIEGLSVEEQVKNQLQAEKLFQKIISKASNNPEYYLRLGLLYAQMRRFPEAIQMYNKGLDINPDNLALRSALGFSYIYKEDLDKAREEFQEVIEKNPKYAEALAGLGRVAELKNQTVEAQNYYDNALTADPYNITALSFMGSYQIKQGHYNEAQDIYERLLKIRPEAVWVKQALEEIANAPQLHQIRDLEDNREFEKASEVYASLLTKGSESPDYYLGYGNLFIKMEKYNDAIRVFSEGLEKNPDSNDLRIALGTAYVLAHQLNDAQEQFEKAKQITPKNAEIIAGLGRIQALSDQPLKAEKLYEQALMISPDNTAALSYYGELLMKQKRFEEAKMIYEHLFELDPKAGWVHRALQNARNGPELDAAMAMTYLGMNRIAKGMFIDLMTKSSNDPDYYLYLGDLYVNMEKYDEAITIYQLGLEIEPDYPVLLRAIAFTYLISDVDKPCCAFNIFMRLLEKDPKDAASWAGLGRVFGVLGYYCTAQTYYATSLELDPNNQTALTYFAIDEEERMRHFSARSLFGYLVNEYPHAYWLQDRYYANYRKSRPILNVTGKYYEEDEWDRQTKKWVARYQVYGGFLSVLYPINNSFWFGGTTAYDYYRLIDQQDHFTYYFFDVSRAHLLAKYVINPCLFTDMKLGMSMYAPFRKEDFAQDTGVAVEPTLSFTYHRPKYSTTWGISSDTDLVARNFNTNTARLVTRYYVFGNIICEPQDRLFWGLEGGYYYLNGFHDNQFQRARSYLAWTPEICNKMFTFRYHILYQNFNKIIPDYYTYAPQLTNHLQFELNKSCTEWTYITLGYAHGWQSTRTRYANIIINQPLVLQPIFWDRRDYNQGFIRAAYDQCPWQIALDADFYRDSKKYTIWHIYLNMSYVF